MEYSDAMNHTYPTSGRLGPWNTAYHLDDYAYAPNPQNPSLISTLNDLYTQRTYLSNLLSRTAVSLNALRERQTKNRRALDTNPTSRSKRKKIEQNAYRTGKTIKTAENEEQVLLDCLRVCCVNIQMVEGMLGIHHGIPPNMGLGMAAGNTNCSAVTTAVGEEGVGNCGLSSSWDSTEPRCGESYGETDATSSADDDMKWNGWADGDCVSPFQRKATRPVIFDEIPPETPIDEKGPQLHDALVASAVAAAAAAAAATVTAGTMKRPPALPPRANRTVPPPPPPNTGRSTQSFSSSLCPLATCFEPGDPPVLRTASQGADSTKKLDKLSITGMLASKRVRRLQSDQMVRRFSDQALEKLFRELKPGNVTRRRTSAASSSDCEAEAVGGRGRTRSAGRGGLEKERQRSLSV
jgi:hypothetical protein